MTTNPSNQCRPGWARSPRHNDRWPTSSASTNELLTVGGQTSPPLEEIADDPADLTAWVTRLPVADKDPPVAQGEAARVRVRMEALRRFRGDTAPTILVPTRQTVADLLDVAAQHRVRP
jgi:hypothetical protein